jgi:hypothetical protein
MDEETVGYTLRDILIRVDKKLDSIDSKLETKADRARVHSLAADVAGVDKRVTVIESQQLDRRLRHVESSGDETAGERKFKRFLWPAVTAIVGSAWWVPTLLGHKP